jgi:hypothetical protein
VRVPLGEERGEGERGWAGSGVSWAGRLPGAAQVGCWFFLFIFSFYFPFLLFLISVLGFEKAILF